jgi:hypothetical protein
VLKAIFQASERLEIGGTLVQSFRWLPMTKSTGETSAGKHSISAEAMNRRALAIVVVTLIRMRGSESSYSSPGALKLPGITIRPILARNLELFQQRFELEAKSVREMSGKALSHTVPHALRVIPKIAVGIELLAPLPVGSVSPLVTATKNKIPAIDLMRNGGIFCVVRRARGWIWRRRLRCAIARR